MIQEAKQTLPASSVHNLDMQSSQINRELGWKEMAYVFYQLEVLGTFTIDKHSSFQRSILNLDASGGKGSVACHFDELEECRNSGKSIIFSLHGRPVTEILKSASSGRREREENVQSCRSVIVVDDEFRYKVDSSISIEKSSCQSRNFHPVSRRDTLHTFLCTSSKPTRRSH